MDRKGRNDDDTARRAAVEWQKVLLAARDRGLKWLQPAQFVRAEGPADERPSPGLCEERLWFCPRAADVIGEATSGSLADAMAKRYKRYRKDTIALFDKILFGATHHLLLVDVLSALGEEDACNETKEVPQEVHAVFTNNGPWSWRLGIGSLKKVMLIATKADAVPPNRRANMNALLS
ncbi:MAG: YcjX family protein, partial [Elioraea sp.]|nr:YcjX family protein [Elioraea sp.]